MTDSAFFALHQPELDAPLRRGEEKIATLMKPAVKRVPSGVTLIEANTEHKYVYSTREGWAGRIRMLPDLRSQFILIFLPGESTFDPARRLIAAGIRGASLP